MVQIGSQKDVKMLKIFLSLCGNSQIWLNWLNGWLPHQLHQKMGEKKKKRKENTTAHVALQCLTILQKTIWEKIGKMYCEILFSNRISPSLQHKKFKGKINIAWKENTHTNWRNREGRSYHGPSFFINKKININKYKCPRFLSNFFKN